MLKKAITFMLISALAFTVLNTFVKYLTHFSVYQIIFFRAIGSLVFTIPFLLKHKISILGNKRQLLVLRGVIGLMSMGLFFKSLHYLPVGSSVSMRYTSPIFAALFAVFLLKEKIKNIQWLCFAIAFGGVLILKGFDTQINITGLLYILGSAIFSGLVFIVIRKIKNSDHPVVVVNYFMVICAIFGGVMSINYWITPNGIEWLLLLSLGVSGYYGQLYMTKAFQIAETNKIAPFKYLEVILTMLIGFVWFKEIYTLWSLLGIMLIISGLVLNILIKPK